MRSKAGIKRIRVFFINCPTLDTDAAAYLILAQNKEQQIFQFEIHHFWIYSHSRGYFWVDDLAWLYDLLDGCFGWFTPRFKLSERARLDRWAAQGFSAPLSIEDWYSKTQAAIAKYDEWVDNRPANNLDSKHDPSIVITETPLDQHFISFAREKLGIISAGEWKVFFKPASALEYILTSVQRMALRLSFDPMINSHFPTRACIFDYSQNQPDFRHTIFLGFLCETCRSTLRNSVTPEELVQIDSLLENRWIGQSASPASVAFYLSKIYRYEVSRATGLNPGIFGYLRQQFQTGFGQALTYIGKWTIIIVLSALAVTLFPNVVSWIHAHVR